jgi:hypothetical protein
VRVGGHIELSNDNPISEKFRNENDVIYEVDAFVNVVLSSTRTFGGWGVKKVAGA